MVPLRSIIQKILFYLLISVFFLEILLIGSQYIQKSGSEAQRYEPNKSSADQKMERVHLVEGVGGSKEWELFAEKAEGFLGQGVWNLEKVKVIFYTNASDSYVVQGNKGQINTGSKDIDIMGDVSTHSTNGYDFQTQTIHYSSLEKELVVPHLLKLRGPRDESGQRLLISGEGITTHLENSLMNIESKVVAQRTLPNHKTLFVSSRKAQLSGRSNLVRFYDTVDLKYENIQLRGPEALFAYEKNNNIPQSIIVTGGVQLADAQKNAVAENIQVNFKEEKYTLRGSPQITQGEDVIKGQEIILYEGGKKVRVENIRARVDHLKKEIQGEK